MVVAELLKNNYNVLIPVGDRLAYDIAVDIKGQLVRIQVKSAWFNDKSKNWVCSLKKTLTNSRKIKRKNYSIDEIDFIIAVIQERNEFFIIPFSKCAHYKSEINLITFQTRQRVFSFKENINCWNLLKDFRGLSEEESSDETCQIRGSLNYDNPEPSTGDSEGVET